MSLDNIYLMVDIIAALAFGALTAWWLAPLIIRKYFTHDKTDTDN